MSDGQDDTPGTLETFEQSDVEIMAARYGVDPTVQARSSWAID